MTINDLILHALNNWDSAEVVAQVAEYLESRNRLDLARKLAHRAIELDPQRSLQPYLTLAFASFRNPSVPQTEGRTALEQGYSATQSVVAKAWLAGVVVDDKDEIERLLAEVKSDDSFEAQSALAEAYQWRGRMNDAYQLIKEFPKRYADVLHPEWGQYCALMLYLYRSGMEGINLEHDVYPCIMRLKQEHYEDITYHFLHVRYHLVRKEYDSAYEVARSAIYQFPDDETMMFTLAGIEEQRGNSEQAIHWCTRAIGAKPQYIGARLRLGGYYEKAGNIMMADMIMDEIPLANPEYGKGFIQYAYYLFRIGRDEQAVTVFSEGYSKLQEWEQQMVSQDEEGRILLQRMEQNA
jgi:tetratricopeptide (TPR) repeat protein